MGVAGKSALRSRPARCARRSRRLALSPRSSHVRDQQRPFSVAGLGDLHLVSHPCRLPLLTEARLDIVGRTDLAGPWRQGASTAPAHLPVVVHVVALAPDLPEDLHRWDLCEPGSGIAADRRQRRNTVAADLFRKCDDGRLATWQPVVVERSAVAVAPSTINGRVEPLRRDLGEDSERVAQGFADPLQPVEVAHRRQHLHRVRPLSPASIKQPPALERLEEAVQLARLASSSQQARAELAQDGQVEAGVGQVQAEGVLPVDARPNGFSGLAVREVLDELRDCHERETPGTFGRMSIRRVEVGEVLVAVQRTERFAYAHAQRAVREGRMSDTSRLSWTRVWGL